MHKETCLLRVLKKPYTRSDGGNACYYRTNLLFKIKFDLMLKKTQEKSDKHQVVKMNHSGNHDH